MLNETQHDWNEVVALKPKGYLELNDGKTATHGPLESIRINAELDTVEIRLKWRAEVPLSEQHGMPEGKWKAAPNEEPIIFPNFVVPFVIEDTPRKGPRIRFRGTSILYIDPIKGIDPNSVTGLKLSQIAEAPGLPLDPCSSYGAQEHLRRRGSGVNAFRTMRFSQPHVLWPGDILATGDQVLSPPREGGNGSVLLHLSGGFDGHWVGVPARIPIALLVENDEESAALRQRAESK